MLIVIYQVNGTQEDITPDEEHRDKVLMEWVRQRRNTRSHIMA
jgi:hypothetical protein